MPQRRLAVMFAHGIEISDDTYATTATRLLREAFEKHSGVEPDIALVIEPLFWAPVLQPQQEDLFDRAFTPSARAVARWLTGLATQIGAGRQSALAIMALASLLPNLPFVPRSLRYPVLRWMVVQLVGDAVAYKPAGTDSTVYENVHAEVARVHRRLAEQAGADAPLCVIAHSLGSVIMSDYLYDLQARVNNDGHAPLPTPVDDRLAGTAMERGETLAFFYTLGSPLALWTVGYPGFGVPLTVPAPELSRHHPRIKGEWVNMFDPDDVIAYPLQGLSDSYQKLVRDEEVSLRPWWAGMTPLSHVWYWNDSRVMDSIGRSLAAAWQNLG